jgi:hypothetical protein
MNQEKLLRVLNSIGKSCFVKYYEDFADNSKEKEDLIQLIVSNERYNSKATSTRVNSAKRIFRLGLETKALEIISMSKKLDSDIVIKAKLLLDQYKKH